MKKIITILILCIVCVSLFACGKKKIDIPEKVTYYDNMSVVGLAKNAEEELVTPPFFVEIDSQILADAGGISLDLCDQYIAKKADGVRLDEYGIFHCGNEKSAGALYQSVIKYVDTRKNDTTTLSHFEDADTVKNGKIAIYGNYVVYTFLPDSGNTLFHTLIESLLTE